MNTSIHYSYRDAGNNATGRTIVLAGELSTEQIDTIIAKLDDGMYFIPSQVGLPDLQSDLQQWDKTPHEPGEGPDHAWHALERSDITLTDADAASDMTADELAEAFAGVEWDETDPSLPFDL